MAKGSRRRPRTQVVALVLWVGVIIAFSLTPDPTGGLEGLLARALSPVAHVTEFLVFCLLLGWVAAKRPLWLLTVAGVLTAFLDESVQSRVPGRIPDINDVLADVLGFVVGVWIARHATRMMPLVHIGVFIAFAISVIRIGIIYVL